ncbi:MAG: hypothetical protein JST46_04420 [Bacteroidetes bacterium]|nr:hypothetical protein [Bacteroidota bacterium]
MAEVLKGSILFGVKGTVGKTFYLRKLRNKWTFNNIPHGRKRNSAKQKEVINRFKEAQQYAKAIVQRPEMKELYSKGISDRLSSAYHVAATDFLNAPKIHYVKFKEYHGAAGDILRIKATDDFQVTEVFVRVFGANGKLLEEGHADRYRRKSFMWVYKTKVAHPDVEGTMITIIAKDRPGNRAIQKLTLDKDRQAKVENEVKLV